MSSCKFIASDMPLAEFSPVQAYTFEINLDNGRIYDGGADDNFHLLQFEDVRNYSDKNYGVYLEWNYTEGRAKQIIEYIKSALQETDSIEFWHVWLMDFYEHWERPFVHRKEIMLEQLSAEHIEKLDSAKIWNTPDKSYPDRPSFYCLTISA